MKMAYETPKMKAELFQTNAYCLGCGSEQMYGYVIIDGNITITIGGGFSFFPGMGGGESLDVKLDKEQYTFDDDSLVKALNQNTGDSQYYYVAKEDSSVYLEWSTPEQAFVLYKEVGSESGFFDAAGNQIFDGKSTLQTNTGMPTSNPAYNKIGERDEKPSAYLYDFTDPTMEDIARTEAAGGWYSDHCLGKVDANRQSGSFVISNS